MNPDLPGYIGRKIGTSDGEYELRSKHIMLNLAKIILWMNSQVSKVRV